MTPLPRLILLSVVIPCTRPESLLLSLQKLAKEVTAVGVEAIVIGDVEASGPQFPGLEVNWIPCAERHPNVRRNLGIARARAPLIGFLDDDAFPLPGWVSAALQMDPDRNEVWTGPERAVVRGRPSALIFAVCQNRFVDGTSAHRNARSGYVSWYEIPFCNLLVPSRIFKEVGMLATDIPWDIDDFHFCFNLRTRMRFFNNPQLAICHDRYPNSIARFLTYRWKLRVRTGEKLLSHMNLYGRICPVVVSGAIPLLLLCTVVFLPFSVILLASAFCIYLLSLFLQLIPAYRFDGRIKSMFQYVGLIALLHCSSLVGVQYGMWRRVLRNVAKLKESLSKTA